MNNTETLIAIINTSKRIIKESVADAMQHFDVDVVPHLNPAVRETCRTAYECGAVDGASQAVLRMVKSMRTAGKTTT